MRASLRNALEKLSREGRIPLSSLGASVRQELEGWGERTGCLQREGRGRGAVLKVSNPSILQGHLQRIRPADPLPEVPSRVRNLLRSRDTKAGACALERQYVLFKAVGNGISARRQGTPLELGTWSQAMGCLVLELSETTAAWHCDHPLLLVENQGLFDDVSWLPEGWQGVLFFYSGVLSHWLIQWLARSHFIGIELFADYDGVGLENFDRLTGSLPTARWHWRADWEEALERLGNPGLWEKEEQRTRVDRLEEKWERNGWPDPRLRRLVAAMRRHGLMLEQEWVLIPGERP